VGNYGKIEAFAPAHGAEADDETLPNFIIGQVNARHRSVTADPPPPVKPEEQHISIDKTLMEAGHHCGATFYELEVFSHVARQKGKAHVDVIDGLLAVAMGLAAHIAIDEQRIVRFSELGVDELWDQKHGNNKLQDVNGIAKVGSGQRLQEMRQVLPPDGEKQAQADGWEISFRRQTSQCSQESFGGYST